MRGTDRLQKDYDTVANVDRFNRIVRSVWGARTDAPAAKGFAKELRWNYGQGHYFEGGLRDLRGSARFDTFICGKSL
jgi:hypothetical protein